MLKQHNCQHTDKGLQACEECRYFGIIPRVRVVDVYDKYNNFRSFRSLLASISMVKFSLNPDKELAEAFVSSFNKSL